MLTPFLPEKMQLSEEQRNALDQIAHYAMGGRLIFVTGRAGTGKSTLLRALKSTFPGKAVILAPTGLAAVNAGGQTIHSFFNFPLGPLDPATSEIPLFRSGAPKSRLIKNLEAIFIDEISMVRADLLDAIDISLRKNRESDQPFGGVPIVAFGDIWQLEPVVAGNAEQEFLAHHYNSPFFFDSAVIKSIGIDIIELKTVHRQANDQEFLWLLDHIREGNPNELEHINARTDASPVEGTLNLTVTNAKAGAINNLRLLQINSPEHHYAAKIEGQFGRELPAEEILRLKPGARVMFIKNSTEWVNGSLGTVIQPSDDKVTVLLDEGKTVEVGREVWEKNRYSWDRNRGQIVTEPVGSFTQYPLRLAWAVTIHKSQGLTFDRIHVELDRPAFSHGQIYVALSRCRSLAGLTLSREISPREIIINSSVTDFAFSSGLLS